MTSQTRNDRIDYVELRVADPNALASVRKFYETAFRWNYKSWGPEYCDTQSSGLSSGVTVDSERHGRPLVVIYADHLESAHARVLAAGARITRDIFSFPGGRRFQFVDPAGNELAVWTETAEDAQ